MAQNLEIVINAQDKTNAAFESAQRSMSSFQDRLEGMKPQFQQMAAAGGIAFGAITAAATTALKAFAADQLEMTVASKGLENALKTLDSQQIKAKFGTSNLQQAMTALTGSMGKASDAALQLGFDDETASTSFSKLFGVTRDVTQANKDLALAMDLARAKNISLEDATQKVIMVHAGATKELKASGIAVNENATSLQNLTLLTERYGGTATEAAKTAAVQFQILQNKIGNLQSEIGEALAPALMRLLEAVQPVMDRFQKWAEQNPDLIAKIILMGGAIAGLVTVVGLLGMALPAIITAFTVLTGPVGAVIAVIALLVINFDTVKQALINLYNTLENYGIIVLFRDIWVNIQKHFSEQLIPAVKQLWEALKPLFPYLQELGKFLGAVFIVTLYAVAKIIEGWIFLFTELLTILTKVGTYVAGVLKSAFDAISNSIDYVANKVSALISSLQSLWTSMQRFGGGMMSGVSNFFGGQKVNDAIITPQGRVITPASDDFIFATKNPASLGGGSTPSMVVNVNGGSFLSEQAAYEFGDILINRLRTELRM